MGCCRSCGAAVPAAPDASEGNTAEAPATTPTVLVPPLVPPIAAVAPALVPPAATPVPKFTDVPDKYFGKSKIEVLQSMGVLQDFGGGKFDPNLPITRGEYAKMLDRAFVDRSTTQQVLEFKDIILLTNYP